VDRATGPRQLLQSPQGGITLTRRRFVPFAVLAALLAALVLLLRAPSNTYLELLNQADASAQELERTAAAAAYGEAARLRPDAALPYLSLARLYLDWGRSEKALDAVGEAERRGAEPAEVERLRAAISAALATSDPAKPSHWTAVVKHARALLALDPEDRNARHVLARAYLGLRRWEAAATVYGELVRSDPDDRRAAEHLGVLRLGDDPDALEYLRLAETDLSQRVIAALSEATSADDPAYASTRVGEVLVQHREWALATRHLELAVARNPGYADAHAYLGYALDQLGYLDDAAPHLLGAVGAAPDSPLARMFLGLHYGRAGDPAAARAQYEAAYDLAPDNPAVCVEIAQTWAAEGRYAAAEIWLREAVSLRPGDPGMWEILTRFYLDHGMTSEDSAIRAADKLLELVPDGARAHDLRGWAAFQIGDYGTAEEYLRRAVELDPMLASGHYHLGLLYLARSHPDRAREAFTRAADLDRTGEIRSLIQRMGDVSVEDG